MPQSLSRILIHTVFSTKNRAPLLREPSFRDEMHAYLGGCANTLGCLPIRIGGTEDHVHLLTTLSRTVAVAEFIKEVKRKITFQDEYREMLRLHGEKWDERYVWD